MLGLGVGRGEGGVSGWADASFRFGSWQVHCAGAGEERELPGVQEDDAPEVARGGCVRARGRVVRVWVSSGGSFPRFG